MIFKRLKYFYKITRAHRDEQSGTMQFEYDVWCRDALTTFYGKLTLSLHPQGSDVETVDNMNNKSSLNIDEM